MRALGCRGFLLGQHLPVAHATSGLGGPRQAGVSYAALQALQTRAQLVNSIKEPSVDSPQAWLAHLGSWPQTSPTWKPRTPGSPGEPWGQCPLKDRGRVLVSFTSLGGWASTGLDPKPSGPVAGEGAS